jgi:phosphate transport system permease protein
MFDQKKIIGWLFGSLTGIASLIIVAMVVVILGNIAYHGLDRLSWGFLTGSPERGMREGGIFPAIFGTVALVILMTIAVIPLGVATAIYMHEYAPKRSRVVGMVRTAIQNLAGVPAIVFGLFGLGFFIEFVGRGIDRALSGGGRPVFGQPAIIWAALTMALLTLPTVVIATEEALRAIPQSYREVAFSLGSTRWQMIRKVLLPQAVGGIMTGAILAVSRGAGEVAPIMFTGAAYYLPRLPTRLNDQFMELGYHVYVMTTQSPNVEATKPILYATVLVLLILTFGLNFMAILIRSRIRRRLRSGR